MSEPSFGARLITYTARAATATKPSTSTMAPRMPRKSGGLDAASTATSLGRERRRGPSEALADDSAAQTGRAKGAFRRTLSVLVRYRPPKRTQLRASPGRRAAVPPGPPGRRAAGPPGGLPPARPPSRSGRGGFGGPLAAAPKRRRQHRAQRSALAA